MKQLEEVKARLRGKLGLRWNEDVSRMARQFIEKNTSNNIDDGLHLLNGETYFFRYPVYLQFLRQRMRRHIAEGGKNFRVLSAGCSTGEEAYTIAFALEGEAQQSGCRLEVIGVDVRPDAIRAAHSGRYRKWSLRSKKVEGLEEYLQATASGWEVRDRYREIVRFQVQNLLEPLAMEPVHAVTTCNVLLYMHEGAIGQVYRNLDAVLHPDGILMIAPTDPAPPASWSLMEASAGWPVFVRAPAPPAVSSAAQRRLLHSSSKRPLKPAAKAPLPAPAPSSHARKISGTSARVQAAESAAPDIAIAEEQSDDSLWLAWARGELGLAADQVRRRLFFEPEHPLWRFLNGVILWENGWLRKSAAEMRKAEELLTNKPSQEMLAETCTVEELQRMIDFWRQQHG